jgi:glyoxylase-like metal-dependent hydrolase (beta-lactamase superfamily II)/rhodanese-related sulfurtransferase
MILETWSSQGCRTHLLVAERTREAVLVDPLLEDADAALAKLKERGLTLRWVIDTHTHADHLSAGAALIRRADAGYLMHASAPTKHVTRRLSDGETLGLGELSLNFLHVPGHTRDSLMIALPGVLLTGDFLFLGNDGAGRLDLPGGDVDAHHDSLRRLDTFGPDVQVRPGHDYRGRSVSTLKDERAANPVLSPRSRDEYLRWWETQRQPYADWMGAVVAANSRGELDPRAVAIPEDRAVCVACTSSTPAPVREWTPAELSARLKSGGLTVIDVREPDEWTGELGRIPGSRLIPLGELPARMSEVPVRGLVVAVCRSGNRSARAAAEMMKAGRTEVISLAGGMLAWNEAGLTVEREAR